MIKRFALGLLLALACPLASNADAADQSGIFEKVMSVCTDLSADIQSIQSRLLKDAWNPEDDKTKTFAALMSQTMAFDFAYRTERSASRGQDLTGPAALFSFIQRNGNFMAASVLGNSGTSMALPTFSKPNYSLSVRGLKSDNPSCLLSGPDSLFDTVSAHPSFQAKDFERVPDQPLRDGGELQFGVVNGLETLAIRLDIHELLEQSTAAGVPFDPRLEALLVPVVISIWKPEDSE